MFYILFKKMLKSKWLILSLTLGLILSISIISSIPMYSDAVLRRTLKRDMENFLINEKTYPGNYTIFRSLSETMEMANTGNDREVILPAYMQENADPATGVYNLPDDVESTQSERVTLFNMMNDAFRVKYIPAFKIPVYTETKILSIYKLLIKDKADGSVVNKYKFGKLEAIYNIQEHIKIINGRMFSNIKTSDNVYEVIVSKETIQTLKLFLNKTYCVYQPYNNFVDKDSFFKIKVVGIYDIKDESDPFWFGMWSDTSERSMIMNFNLFSKGFLEENKKIVLNELFWGYAFDYTKITHRDIPYILKTYSNQRYNELKRSYEATSSLYVDSIFKNYLDKEKRLKTILWIYQTPILLMLLLYTFMVSRMIIEQDIDEISVLKSRGAKSGTILSVYFWQSILLGLFSLITGPPLGMFLCKLIGSANGFLNFIHRDGLIVTLKLESYIYSFLAILIFIVTIMISAYKVSKNSIVEVKQNKFRRVTSPIWKRGYFDIILLIISLYGLYSFKIRQAAAEMTTTSSAYLPVDPLLYIISTLFIMGLGLMFLRVYPYIIKFVFWCGRNKWNPASYSSLINVGRAGSRNQFVMLFLLLTTSIGIFSLKSAATININLENKVKYLSGCDAVVETKWESSIDSFAKAESSNYRGQVIYNEPDFTAYKSIPGVLNTTKVLLMDDISIDCVGKQISKRDNKMMGIIPGEFGKTAWFDDSLISPHWYNYLNTLSTYPNAVLLSRNFESNVNIHYGDNVQISWTENGGGNMDAIVVGFIDYWPGYNPMDMSGNYMIISNFNYLQEKKLFIPYQIWINKDKNVTDEMLMQNITKKIPNITSITFAGQTIRNVKNDAIIQGTNGSLSLGFISTMIITIIGFLIYWTLSLKSRTLQFGILRAIGLTVKSVISMLMYEQVLISCTAVAIGAFIGELDCYIFAPLIQITQKSSEQILPFKVFAQNSDYFKLFGVVAAVLIIGFIILARYASNLKIDQAVKLGED